AMRVQRWCNHTFLPNLIRPEGVVFDFGVHDGEFSKRIAPLCRRVIGFEPDPIWEERLVLPDNVRVIRKALGASAGLVRLNLNHEICPSVQFVEDAADSVEVEAVTLAQALEFETDRRIELIKLDIEGEEVAVLRETPREVFERVAQMTVEFHDFMD